MNRSKEFLHFSYEDWGAIHDECVELAKTAGEISFSKAAGNLDQLPPAIRRIRPHSIRTSPDFVFIRFGGGFWRLVAIHFESGGELPGLDVNVEPLFFDRGLSQRESAPTGRPSPGSDKLMLCARESDFALRKAFDRMMIVDR